MSKEHRYKLKTTWHGNTGSGTSHVHSYDRSHTVSIVGKPELHLTTDNAAVGDKTKLNPEDLFVAAISSCHMLSYLYLCSMQGVVVVAYDDEATGTMIEFADEGGRFQEVVLRPVVVVAEQSMVEKAIELHHDAHAICYIANSVNFEVKHIPVCKVVSS